MAQLEAEVAEALYDFDASHNDEKLDGGWWEGGIGTRSGWFPEALVRLRDCSVPNGKTEVPEAKLEKNSPNGTQQQSWEIEQPQSLLDVAPDTANGSESISNGHGSSNEYLSDVVRSIVAAEQTYFRQLKSTREEIFWPLSSSNLLLDDDYVMLCGNLDDLIDIYEKHVDNLHIRSGTGSVSLGQIFLQLVDQIRPCIEIYCANHPRGVMLINKYRDTLAQFCRRNRAAAHVIANASSSSLGEPAAVDDETDLALSANALPLAGILSMPFRRLERYPMMLQEYLRYLPESDADHVKTRRTVEAFTQLNADLSEIRRQKEIEIELESGNIENYQGPPLLGPIQAFHKFRCLRRPEHINGGGGGRSNAGVHSSTMHIAVFQQILVIMSTSSHLSEFACESWFYLSDVNLTLNEEDLASDHATTNGGGPPPVAVEKLYFAIDCISSNDRWSFSSPKSSATASNFLQRLANAIQQCKPLPNTQHLNNGIDNDADDDQFFDESSAISSSRIPDRRGRRLHSASQRTNGSVGRKIAPPASSSSESSTSVPTSLSSSSSSHLDAHSAADGNNIMSRRADVGSLNGTAARSKNAKHIAPGVLLERQRSIQQLKKMFRQAPDMPSLRPNPPLRPAGGASSGSNAQETHAQEHRDAIATLGASFSRNVMQTSSARVGKSSLRNAGEAPVLLTGKKFGAVANGGQAGAFEKQASGFVYNKPAACYQYETSNNIESDSSLLNVVESYCSSSRARSNVNSESTKVIVPHDETLLIEDADGNLMGERSLIDTVYYLNDRVTTLFGEIRRLTDERDAERRNTGSTAARHAAAINGTSTVPTSANGIK